ncbi:MAG: family 43 glycosylhydrolase, partial [Bacillota bacterium]
ILTTRDDPAYPLQRAGHGDIVQTQNGEWYMAHLCGRPLTDKGRCILGRETCIQKMAWTDDLWLRLANGGRKPQLQVSTPGLPEHPWDPEPMRDDFDSPQLNINFQTLRLPLGEDSLSLTERKGYLRLKGRESLGSKYVQSLVARRQGAFCYTASTCVEFEPETFQQMAGLICLYDTQNFYYLYITRDETLGKCLGIFSCQNNTFEQPLDREVPIEGWQRCYLRVDVDNDRLQFSYSPEGVSWITIGPVLDTSTLSDEFCQEGQYTGAFVGLCCQDLSGRRKPADFDYFEYRERESG